MKSILHFRTISTLLLLFVATLSHSLAQEFTLSGTVSDVSKQPIAGANIVINGTQRGTTTNAEGVFQLPVSTGDILSVSYIGYVTEQVVVRKAAKLDVVLRENPQALSEVVVIGYGTVQKKDLTGSIESIGSKELNRTLVPNVTEALNGRISGVVVNKSSNRPGAGMSVQIRGINSFNFSNEPLYVIDGVPSQTGMRHLNTADIESIDILKDASSSAIYGSRGANGVVIITTKGASKNKGLRIEYTGYTGVKTPTRIPDMIGNMGNGLEYVDYKIALWKKKYGDASLNRSDFLTTDEKRRVKYGEYYDWLREFTQNATINSHSISASGGSEHTSYTFGLGYLGDQGLVKKENFQRITANIGLEHRFSDRLKLGINSYLSLNNTNPGANDALLNAYFLPPVVSPYDKNGDYAFIVQPTSSKVNPFVQVENNRRETDAQYTNLSSFLEFKPVSSLSLTSRISLQTDASTSGEWIGSYTQAKMGVSAPDAFRSEDKNLNWTWDNIATWKKTLNEKHDLNVIGLFSLQKDTHRGSSMRGIGLPYESDWHAIQTAEQLTDVTSYYWESSMASFMGRANYTFNDRYLLTLTGRYDGSSRLSTGNQWGFMPSAAIGWNLANEDFMKSVRFVNNLKLRLSYGKSGNNNISYDVTRSKLDLTRYVFGGSGVNGFGLGGTKGNRNLRWEMTSEWNLGLDFGLFGNRISGSIDAYSRLTKDLIFARAVASVNGFTSTLENVGSTSNKGIELGLNTVNIENGTFSWKTNLTFSLNRNKIVDLYGDKKDDLANRWFIGSPMRVIYDLEKQGIWQEEEKEQAGKYGQVPGHIKVRDVNGDANIDERDYRILGSPLPSWTGGMTNTVTYKNWDLSAYVYARVGGLYNDEFTYIFTAWDNEHWNKLNVNYWTPENRSNDFQEIGAQSYYTQVLGKIPGTFAKIQNITLGYTFKTGLLQRLKLQQGRVFASVQNAFTFTGYRGPDPETIGENVYTQLSMFPRTYMLGLQFSF